MDSVYFRNIPSGAVEWNIFVFYFSILETLWNEDIDNSYRSTEFNELRGVVFFN